MFPKRIFFIVVWVTVSAGRARACEICGCGIGNSYIGILPEFNKNIFGFRYRYNSMLTHIGVGGTTTYLTTAENYRTLEAWGGLNLSRSFRLMATVPYSFEERMNQGITSTKNGLGDISVSGFYQLIQSGKTITGLRTVQSLWIGVGVKLPTGNYNAENKNATVETANLFQLGTGSTDFFLTGMYDLRVQDAGLNITGSYRINTVNRYHYQYGNKFSISGQLYYKIRLAKGLTVSPNAGLLLEMGRKDSDHGLAVEISGGNLLLGSLGAELVYNKIAVGGNWQTPLTQNLANGIIKANNRMMLHLSFIL
jgi:hypothetical protein